MSDKDATSVLGENLTDDKSTKDEVTTNDYLDTLVGEGKKYTDPESLAKAYSNADTHISTLTTEAQELRGKIVILEAEKKTADQILEALSNQPDPVKEEPAVNEPVDIEGAIAKALADRDTKSAERVATDKAWEKLETAFGDKEKAKVAMSTYANGDPAKIALMNTLGGADPDGLVKLLGGAVQSEDVTFTNDSPELNQPELVVPRGMSWSKCEALRKDNPKYYKSREFQNLMHQAAGADPNFMKT